MSTNLLDRFKDGVRALGLSELLSPAATALVKTAYNVTPVGVQGRPQRATADINGLVQAYRTSEIVYACINAKAVAAVDPRLIVERRKGGDDNWQEIEGHPMRRLIMRPNPLMDEAGFARAVLTSMDVAGVFYAEIVRANNRPNALPVALYPLDPAKIKAIPDGFGGISAYEWRDGLAVQIIPADDLLVWRNYDPQNRYNGLSPLSVALGSIVGDNLQTDYIRSFFETGGVPSGILTIKNRSVTPTESDILRAKWRSKFNPRYGGIKDDIAVLDENAEFQVLGSRLDQLQNQEVRGVAESRICMVFSVPPLIVYAYIGLMRATYSNLKEAWAQFWASYLTPWFKQYRSWLTWSLLSQFEDVDLIYGERLRLAHDMSEVAALQDDVNAKHTRARANLQAGAVTINEFREIIGQKPDTINGNAYLRTMGMMLVPFEETETAVAEGDGSTAIAATPTADAQSQVLNGAQIDALTSILQSVSANELAPAAAIEVLAIAFPTVTRETITTMVNAAADFVIVTPEPTITVTGPSKSAPVDEGAALTTAGGPVPAGYKLMLPGQDWMTKALRDRDRIADKNITKIERYLMAQYTLAANAVKARGKASDESPEVKATSLEVYIEGLLDDGEDVAEVTRSLFVASLKKGFGDGAHIIRADLSFDLENTNIQKVLGQLLKQVKKDIPQTTIEQIRGLISKQASEGWSIDRLADEILATGEIQSASRAQLIAHTETARAYSQGSLVSFEESGVVDEVEWNSFLDDRTSEVCTELNGQRVKLGTLFAGGFDGPPAHPQCRSALIPIVKT